MLEARPAAVDLADAIASRRAQIGVIGLGYVGLPLAVAFAEAFPTLGFDVDAARVESLNAGRSHIADVPDERVRALVGGGRLTATFGFERLAACDCIVVCVPTPLDRGKEPDLSYIVEAGRAIAAHLRPGQLIVLESTTYPGTTDEIFVPLLEAAGLEFDRDFFVAFSPERVDPGNETFALTSIPKVVGGCSETSGTLAAALYAQIFERVHRVSDARVAEAAKLLENTFRSVNIGLANEMSMLCRHLGISSSEVIDAAATKPFGFMAFRPGPGVGGHCIPLDPLYLSWKARQYGFTPRFIALADEVNSAMPDYVVRLVAGALNDAGQALRGARVLLLGVTYKEDVADTRHSPALTIIERLRAAGAHVRYHDPYVPRIDDALEDVPEGRQLAAPGRERRSTRRGATPLVNGTRRLDPLESVPLDDAVIASYDCVVVTTAHRAVDYARVARAARLVIDTRNVVPPGENATGIVAL